MSPTPKLPAGREDADPPSGGWGWLLLGACNLGAAGLIGFMAWTLGQAAAPLEPVPGLNAGADQRVELLPASPPPAPETVPAWARPAELSPHHFGVPGR